MGTWGISPEDFTTLWLSLAGAAIVIAIITRMIIRASVNVTTDDLPDDQLAYFDGGLDRLVLLGVAELHLAGAVTSTPDGKVVATGAELTAPSTTARTIYRALKPEGSTFNDIRWVQSVRALMGPIRASLVEKEWVPNRRTRVKIRLASLPVWAVVVLGAARIIAGLGNGLGIADGISYVVVLAFIGMFFQLTPDTTMAAKRAMEKIPEAPRRTVRDVAMRGAPAIYAIDPVLGPSATEFVKVETA